jgi:hypothetical protein
VTLVLIETLYLLINIFMVRIVTTCLLLFASFQLSFGKSVDESTAKNIGYQFCKSQGSQTTASELTTALVATSVIDGETVNNFYVFNTGNAGFVMVSADDIIVPVLAYSTESSFNAGYIPSNVGYWLDNYKKQISAAIKSKIVATEKTKSQWAELQVQNDAHAKITTTIVLPLMKTTWNQEPNYNYLCPFDNGAAKNVLTGCVATAMAQVMKYWNWPKTGAGTHTYYDGGYGALSADFGSTSYQWDSMPSFISANNVAIGTLMYQAGVSVDMSYGVSASGAYVLNTESPVTNCTQYALPAYFGYKHDLVGLNRNTYTDSDWVYMLQKELNAKRPIIYSGFGSQGGHCFVTDGYITYDRFHFNWGWGGYANGYFIVEALNPGGDDFNNDQSVIMHIEPDSGALVGVKELAFANGAQVYPNPANEVVNIELNGTKTTQIRLLDASGRSVKIVTPEPKSITATIGVSDLVPGVYVAELHTAEGIVTKKIVIER